ncbi:MAG TPA: hypothetical protein VEI27_02160 [Dehalococcoidales bacterium]|nr:hypothetical protein [Dehalococcoidales bacterium]
MAKYLLIYFDGKMPKNKEESDKTTADWMRWFQNLGKAVIDSGNPTKPVKLIDTKGMKDIGNKNLITGYSILEAESMDKAMTMSKSSPHLTSGGQIALYEITPMM